MTTDDDEAENFKRNGAAMRAAVSVQQDHEVSHAPVAIHALIQRLNKTLSATGQALRTTRARWRSDLGDYYIVDFTRNTVVAKHVNPEALAREMGLLRSWETVR
jgi:hypothetical protein